MKKIIVAGLYHHVNSFGQDVMTHYNLNDVKYENIRSNVFRIYPFNLGGNFMANFDIPDDAPTPISADYTLPDNWNEALEAFCGMVDNEKDVPVEEEKTQKSQIRIEPKHEWRDRRVRLLIESVHKCLESAQKIPIEWIKEYNELTIMKS